MMMIDTANIGHIQPCELQIAAPLLVDAVRWRKIITVLRKTLVDRHDFFSIIYMFMSHLNSNSRCEMYISCDNVMLFVRTLQ